MAKFKPTFSYLGSPNVFASLVSSFMDLLHSPSRGEGRDGDRDSSVFIF